MFSRRTTFEPSGNPLSLALAAARQEGRTIVDLSESNPTRVGLESPELVALLGDPKAARYEPASTGILPAREAIARYYEDRGLSVSADRICLSASTSEAYSWLFKLLCEKGDRVLVPSPSYPLFEFLATLEDVSLGTYPLLRSQGYAVDLRALEAAIDDRTKAILMVHPNNPTGSFVSRRDAAAIEALAARHDLALIVDEVFGDFPLGSPAEDCLPSFVGPRSALTFVLSGLSKVVALPQVKLGWTAVMGPQALAKEAMSRLEIIADTFLSVSTPVQLATSAILAQRGPAQERIRERTKGNLDALDAALAALGSEAPIRRLPVEAGWYATLEVPRTRDEDEWVELLIREEGIQVHPGYFFDFAEDGLLVVSLLPEPSAFRDAVARLLRKVAAG